MPTVCSAELAHILIDVILQAHVCALVSGADVITDFSPIAVLADYQGESSHLQQASEMCRSPIV